MRISFLKGVAVVAGAALVAGVPHPAARKAAAVTASPIKHVVLIYQENQTFDSMLAAICKQRTRPCDGYTGPVTLASGTTVQNGFLRDVLPQVGHSTGAQKKGMSGNWNKIDGCQASTGYACIGYADPSTIPNLRSLANTYAVSDRTFAAATVSSFTAHVELAAGTVDGFNGQNPIKSSTGAAPGPGWGCPSNLDMRWGVGFQATLTKEPSCIPLPDGSGAYRKTRVPHVPSLMEQLEAAGLTWHIYVGAGTARPESFMWNICSYLAWCQQKRQAQVSPFSTFTTDAKNGDLAEVSLIPATSKWSQHNGTSLSFGDNYLGSLVGAAMNGPQWSSTAVFVTYDDCGCFYDHVTPPKGRGLRNPLVIVSPWVKRGYTDSVVADQPYSILAFIDHNFGLDPLTPQVGAAYDYGNSFDFSSPIATSPPTMVRTPISRHTRAVVRRLLDTWEDEDGT